MLTKSQISPFQRSPVCVPAEIRRCWSCCCRCWSTIAAAPRKEDRQAGPSHRFSEALRVSPQNLSLLVMLLPLLSAPWLSMRRTGGCRKVAEGRALLTSSSATPRGDPCMVVFRLLLLLPLLVLPVVHAGSVRRMSQGRGGKAGATHRGWSHACA